MPPDEDDSVKGEKTVVRAIADVARESGRAQKPCFIVLSGNTSIGQMFELSGEMVIGRLQADVRLEDEGISRRHAKVTVHADGKVELEDLGSTNGTFHNGRRIDVQLLADGDKIQVGSSTVLKFTYQDALDQQFQQNLYESATRDGLTQLYNKKFLLEALQKEFSYALRHGAHLSLAMLDVDHFKRINDTHGHPAGDYVLQRLARRAIDASRKEDILARYGGEEIAILLRQTPRAEGLVCAERIRSAVEAERFMVNGVRLPVTVSLGVASMREDGAQNPEVLLLLADRALYLAKQRGRNRVEGQPAAP